MHVIGTAGHVDHGKSALIEALTGTHPDRLKEEQAREMTIDLGFGWFTLPDGQEVGIVDVPGHRDFVENMLAGVAGIDAALLVIAVDEGIMPQTTEHLAILELLRIPTGVIALTKLDLVSDSSRIAAVREAARAAVRGTALEDGPIVAVSARTGRGLPELQAALSEVLHTQPARPDLGRPRLAIDRVFTMSGFGTVVTGTLSDGALRMGDEVELLPSGQRGRVRGLQTHRRKIEEAVPGSRTAVNLAGIPAEGIGRGEVLSHPGCYQPTRRIDARVRLLADASRGLTHGCEVKLFLGTSDTVAVVRLLGADELTPRQEGWIQLDLRQPLTAARGDPFIIRWPSPSMTLGGGVIVDPHPTARHKRFDPMVLASLGSLAAGDPTELVLEVARALHASPVREVVLRSHLAKAAAETAIRDLIRAEKLVALEPGELRAESDLLVITGTEWVQVRTDALRMVAEYHARFPLRAGIPRQELRTQLGLPARPFNALLSKLNAEAAVGETKNVVALPAHKITFSEAQQAAVDQLIARFGQSPYAPPSIKECQASTGDEIVAALITLGELVPVSAEVAFRTSDYESMVLGVRQAIEQKGQITLGEVRDLFHTSRRYAQPFLEHLDAAGFTRRVGDARVLAAAPIHASGSNMRRNSTD